MPENANSIITYQCGKCRTRVRRKTTEPKPVKCPMMMCNGTDITVVTQKTGGLLK